MEKFNFKSVGPVYIFWYNVFSFIEKFLPLTILKKIHSIEKIKNLPDYWVAINFILSIVLANLIYFNLMNEIKIIALYYSIFRILEIVVYQINVLLFHPYRSFLIKEEKYTINNPYRSVLLLFHNLGEVIFWFTMINIYFGYGTGKFLTDIMTNTIRIFTFNYEYVANDWFQSLIFIEVVCGMILTIVSLAKFVGELPHIEIYFEYNDELRNEIYNENDRE